MRMQVHQTGGDKLERVLSSKPSGPDIRVGFFASARYQDGEQVAAVAASNEFGDGNIPERPFFRRSVATMTRDLKDVVRRQIDTETMKLSNTGANRVGAWTAGVVQEEITDLRRPPNSPYTIKRKGSSNPLIDTGFMRQSVTWKVD